MMNRFQFRSGSSGSWSDDSPYKKTESFSASMQMVFYGTDLTLTVGTGVNHSMFDVYIGGSLYKTFDGYAASAGTKDISIELTSKGLYSLEIRNRPQHSLKARQDAAYDKSKKIMQFKQLIIADSEYDLHTIQYEYDALSRLLNADYYAGNNVSGTPFESYEYGFDVAGNLTNMDGVTRTYNAANQMSNDGTNTLTYDNNGNLTSHGTQASIWDAANRLKSMGRHSYAYDGLNNCISQTVSSVVTKYLLDVQPGLTKVIGATTSGSTERYVHAQRGVHAMEDSSGVWTHPAQDGLGNVRMQLDDNLSVDAMRNFDLYGDPFGVQGTFDMPFGFTGEMTDSNGLSYLRAHYYNPETGTFTALDPWEGTHDRAMSLNGYSWVEGRVVNGGVDTVVIGVRLFAF